MVATDFSQSEVCPSTSCLLNTSVSIYASYSSLKTMLTSSLSSTWHNSAISGEMLCTNTELNSLPSAITIVIPKHRYNSFRILTPLRQQLRYLDSTHLSHIFIIHCENFVSDLELTVKRTRFSYITHEGRTSSIRRNVNNNTKFSGRGYYFKGLAGRLLVGCAGS